ncbi:MAG: extracellular solute-binding protein, partial [Anaerolineae bacterium]|nr:extracellular solute-binding protein [Anaerolineae bacterium]
AAQEATPEEAKAAKTVPPTEAATAEPTGVVVLEKLTESLGVALPKPEEDPINRGILEAIGVDFRHIEVPAGQMQLAVRIAGGDPPDLMGLGKTDLQDYARQGILLDWGPYLDQLGPAIEFIGGKEALKAGQVDGKQYAFPSRVGWSPRYFTYWIRNDWLDALDSEAPTTLEEFADVMSAMTFDDPDGDGKDNTFGLSGGQNSLSPVIGAFTPIFGAYGVGRPGDFTLRDGELISAYLDPAMPDALAFMRDLVAQGVVDPELVTNTAMVHRDKAFQGVVGTIWTDWASMMKDEFVEQRLAIDPNCDWAPLSAPHGPGGAASSYWSPFAAGGLALPKDLEPAKIQAVIDLLNFVASKEGVYLTSFGVEGKHYTIDDEGHVVRTELLDKEGGYFYYYQILGRDDQTYLYSKFVKQIPYIDFAFNEPYITIYNALIDLPEGYNPADANTYAVEEIVKFIYGDRPLDEWDDFVDTLLTTYDYQQMVDAAKAVDVTG